MGLKRKFPSYIIDNITLKKGSWEIDFDEYNNLNKNIFPKDDKKETDGSLVLIIDGISFFYEVGEKLNYFPFDYKLFIKEIQEVKKKIIFSFNIIFNKL